MNTIGIIAEYNPFHNGHKHHIAEARAKNNCQNIVVVMSGNFVQRGEPAIIDKWARTKAALQNGADIVIELPTMFSCATAQLFAHSAIKILDDTNIVDGISFGSEIGDISLLKKTASLITNEDAQMSSYIKEELEKGCSFPVAREAALRRALQTECTHISTPNNILAVEYLKAINTLKSSMIPTTIPRIGEGYSSAKAGDAFSSATGIRKSILTNNYTNTMLSMPENSFQILKECIQRGTAPINFDSFSQALNFSLRNLGADELSKIADVSEGLENRILSALDNAYTTTEILEKIKTKRYTYTRLQRALLHSLLNIKTKDIMYFKENGFAPYIRVLGFKKNSQHLLTSLVKNASIPVITNFKQGMEHTNANITFLLNLEKKATDIYFLGAPNPTCRNLNKEYTTPVVII